jgi:4-amino-4-deoxychorismate lyase
MPSDTEFQLFTSLRYDPLLLSSAENSEPWLNFTAPSPFYMLVYHRDRMVEAAQHFDFAQVVAKLEDGKTLHESLLSHVREYVAKGGQNEALKVGHCYLCEVLD